MTEFLNRLIGFALQTKKGEESLCTYKTEELDSDSSPQSRENDDNVCCQIALM